MKGIKIVNAKYVIKYRILFFFSDQTEQEVDFSNFLKNATHPEIRKYLNASLFKKFKIVDGDIDWNDFDMCFPVSDLYRGIIDVTQKKTA